MCSLPQLGRVLSEGKSVADTHIDAPDITNGVRHEDLIGFRCCFVLHGEALAIETWALSVQGTFGHVRTHPRIIASTRLTPNIQ